MSSEQRELELIKEKGQFKALPLKRTILERLSYEPKKVERPQLDFKEFKLRTNELESSKRVEDKIAQIREAEKAKFEYIPFKARPINQKIL